METPERIWFLFSRSISGDASPEDQEELMRLLQQQPELMQQYEMLQRLWAVPAKEEPEQKEKISHILKLSAAEEIEDQQQPDAVGQTAQQTGFSSGILRDSSGTASAFPEQSPKKTRSNPEPISIPARRWRPLYRWAAVLASCALLATFYHLWFNHKDTYAANEIVAPKGSKTRTILPDGSTVWLNAGSRIVYTDFNGPSREVTLEGEAFFDVMHALNRATGEKLPFIVHAGNIDIKVLGTAFNVKSYPDDKTIETTLIRGLVQILRKDVAAAKAPPLYLHPNEKIVLPKEVNDVVQAPALQKPAGSKQAVAGITQLDSTLKEDERIETAWVYNRLQFRGDSFEQLAPKLERWYNVHIHFEDENVRLLEFNGSFANETVEQAFEGLKAANAFNVTIKNNEIYISSVK